MGNTELEMEELHVGDSEMGVVEEISKVLENSGVDARSALYDESLTLAREGLLGPARDRLRMLLCLDPDDGEAHLLLAKVFMAQQRWSDALSQLDAAQSRIHVPQKLRHEIEKGLEEERASSEMQHERVATRERAELNSLRNETRRLRTENTRVFRDRKNMQRRIQTWSALSAVLAGVSLTLLVLLWLSPGGQEPVEETQIADAPAPPELQEEPVEASAPSEADSPASREPTVESDPEATPTSERRVHTVVSGDTLYDLAREYYGDASEWRRIRDANSERIAAGNKLRLGTELVIP